MKKFYILFVFLLSSSSQFKAAPADSIWTVYTKGEFSTQCQQSVNASSHVVDEVTTELVSDFHDVSGKLFDWAFKDLGLQNKNNELVIVFKSSAHDEKTGITHGVFDIVVPHFTTFKNIKVDAKVSKIKITNGSLKVNADILYSTLLLDKAFGVLTVIPLKNNEQILVTNVRIKFGWFFNLFITKKRYKGIVEWRVEKFTENMKNQCEQRQKKGN